MTASTMAGAITAHGSANIPMRWCAFCSLVGRYASQSTRPSTKPKTAPTTPTMTPLASRTSRTLRSVAPMDSSIPRERIRRCASTVKPPIDTKAMRSMPTVASASTMVAGLMMLSVFEPGVVNKGGEGREGFERGRATRRRGRSAPPGVSFGRAGPARTRREGSGGSARCRRRSCRPGATCRPPAG